MESDSSAIFGLQPCVSDPVSGIKCFPKRNVETTFSTLNLRVPYQTMVSHEPPIDSSFVGKRITTCNMYILDYILWSLYVFICFYTCIMYPYHSISRFSSLLFFPWPQGCLDKSSNLERPSWSSVLYLGDIGGPTMILDQAPWFFVVFGCFRPGSFVECFWFIWPSILRSTLCSWVEHKKLIRQSAGCMRVYLGNRFKHPKRLVFLV